MDGCKGSIKNISKENTTLKEENVKLENDNMLLRSELQRFEAKFDGFQNMMMEELRKLQMSGNQSPKEGDCEINKK